MSDTDHAVQFWNWFESNATHIHDAYRARDCDWLDKQISPRVKSIADLLNWEIGPYHEPDDSFVLSPTIRENLPITRAAIAVAPRLDGWRFLPAKPPKALLSLTFSARDCTVNADDWRYRLTAYNNLEFIDIEIFVNARTELRPINEDLFCELVVEALVGEERRLERIGYLIPTVVEDNTAIENTTPIRYLKEHLEDLLDPTQSEA